MEDASLQEALEQQARKHAEEQGWSWGEPVEVLAGSHEGDAVWIVRTNVLMRGSNIRVLIRKSDQQIVHSGYLRR